MSIDWLFDLERAVQGGKEIYACPGVGKNQWVMGKSVEELKKIGKRTADLKKVPINIVRVVPKSDAVAGDLFLVPTVIGDPGARGEPQVEWKPVETREAADTMKDVRHGECPFFGIQVMETIDPAVAA